MPLKSKDGGWWVVARYNADGDFMGWATSRDTWSPNPVHAQLYDKVNAEKAAEHFGLPRRLYVGGKPVEGARTPYPGDMFIVERPKKATVESDPLKGKLKPPKTASLAGESRMGRPDARMVDTGARKKVGLAVTESTDTDTETEGGDTMPLKGKTAAAKKGAKSPAKATKPVTKPTKSAKTAKGSKRKSAAKKGPVTDARSLRQFKCLCGCKKPTANFFLRGHIKRFRSQLEAVKAGTTKPESAFGAELAKAMGPWKPVGKGFKPTTTDYVKLRAAVS